jgi:hypothetical protein
VSDLRPIRRRSLCFRPGRGHLIGGRAAPHRPEARPAERPATEPRGSRRRRAARPAGASMDSPVARAGTVPIGSGARTTAAQAVVVVSLLSVRATADARIDTTDGRAHPPPPASAREEADGLSVALTRIGARTQAGHRCPGPLARARARRTLTGASRRRVRVPGVCGPQRSAADAQGARFTLAPKQAYTPLAERRLMPP